VIQQKYRRKREDAATIHPLLVHSICKSADLLYLFLFEEYMLWVYYISVLGYANYFQNRKWLTGLTMTEERHERSRRKGTKMQVRIAILHKQKS
jgi:hypothetical protein